MLFTTGDSISLPRAAASVEGAERLDYAILLALAANADTMKGYPATAPALASALNCTAAKVEASVAFWIECGVLSDGETTSDKAGKNKNPPRHLTETAPPSYNGDELASLLEADGGRLRALTDECQNILGKLFNPSEISKIVALHDYLRLTEEHILLLCTYCVSAGKGSVHYIARTAYDLYDEGVDTADRLEAYIKRREETAGAEGAVRRVIGAGGRALTAGERTAAALWIAEWGMPEEMLTEAYSATVEHCGAYRLAYMKSILNRWHNAGYETVADVRAAEEARSAEKSAQSGGDGKKAPHGGKKAAGGSFDTDDFISAALGRSYSEMNIPDPSKSGV